VIPPGAVVISDPVDLAVPRLADLAVSLYAPDETGMPTAHAIGLHTTYIARGNAVGAATLGGAETTTTYPWLYAVDVLAPSSAGAIVAFGDSITDGYATTVDKDQAWPTLLAARLAASKATEALAVVNAGIAGNRVLRTGVGASALARLDRDVVSRAGVRWMTLLEGINDITFSAIPAMRTEVVTADALIRGYRQIIDRAHVHGIKVMGATIMPMQGVRTYTEDGEAIRQAVNRWIRTSGAFDAVVDFDAVVRDSRNPKHLRSEFDCGDHVHPNDAGNAAMAAAIDVSVFAR
jgi:lysophospholipase L1-like esterase